jgi:hypothetical protein
MNLFVNGIICSILSPLTSLAYMIFLTNAPMGIQLKSFEIDQLAKGVGYFIMLYGGAFQGV